MSGTIMELMATEQLAHQYEAAMARIIDLGDRLKLIVELREFIGDNDAWSLESQDKLTEARHLVVDLLQRTVESIEPGEVPESYGDERDRAKIQEQVSQMKGHVLDRFAKMRDKLPPRKQATFRPGTQRAE